MFLRVFENDGAAMLNTPAVSTNEQINSECKLEGGSPAGTPRTAKRIENKVHY